MRWLALAAAVVAAVAFAWSTLMPSRDAHRFRLTVEVETPDGLRSGSSIVEVERKRIRWPVPGSRYAHLVRGEAAYVDLGGGRNLLALLAHGENAEDVDRINSFWVEAYDYGRYDEDVWSGQEELRGAVELRPPLIPTLITFADPLDPNTVRVVRPGEFEQAFGPGFRFRRATLEMVPRSVSVTNGVIEQRLPWLVGMTTNLAGLNYARSNDIRERLGPRSFKRQGR